MKNTFSSEHHTMGLHLFLKQTFEMNIQSVNKSQKLLQDS